MCECQGNPLARVTLALGLPYLLVNRAIVTASEQKVIKAIFTIFSSEFKTSDVLNTWLQRKWRAQTWLCVWPRSIYQYSDMAPRLSGQKRFFFSSFFCLSISKRDLSTKKTLPDIEVCPESLRFMLEYWYIERGSLVFVLNGCSLALSESYI